MKNTLENIFSQHVGKRTDKWFSYLKIYEDLFREYKNKKINILEIGIQNGGSLEIWSKYFDHAENIVGCDIDDMCSELQYGDPSITVVTSNINSDDTERKIYDIANKFDIIIDDGSHRSGDIIGSFCRYFPYLNPNGLYIIEDMHCSYWEQYEGGLYNPFSSISFFKSLVDIINQQHWGIELNPQEYLQHFHNRYDVSIANKHLRSIHSIKFTNSLCIIEKKYSHLNLIKKRITPGNSYIFDHDFNAQKNKSFQVPDQKSNRWFIQKKQLDSYLNGNIIENDKLRQRITDLESRITLTENSLLWKYGNYLKILICKMRKFYSYIFSKISGINYYNS